MFKHLIYLNVNRILTEHSSVGRALDCSGLNYLKSGGHRFNSDCSDLRKISNDFKNKKRIYFIFKIYNGVRKND